MEVAPVRRKRKQGVRTRTQVDGGDVVFPDPLVGPQGPLGHSVIR